ncbi:PucR family transcriptional regulator [Arthrobacter sp. JSM 101049]|uniref:PucR family transcriptional regulator n=1 Tax=Arthrobacter sp. JSM 101049 TaxID=929097 RepID=UPI0035667BE8
MAMTVRELVAEPQLGLELLAGAEGADRPITWSHTSDLPSLWEWVSPGVLLMTNGMSIPEDPASQVQLAEALVEAGAVALAVGAKMHAPEFSTEFVAACASLPLPLISIPYPLPFIAISRAIAEASLLEESRRIRQTARIYDLLRKATSPKESWPELLGGIAAELRARVHVVDAWCLHPWQPGDPALPAGLIDRVRGINSASTPGTRHFLWNTDGDSSILLMEIPTHPHALLVVLPEAETKPDGVVLLHVATVLGLGLSRTALAMEGQYRSGGEFLLQAFGGRITAAEASRRLEEFGIPDDGTRMLSLPEAPETNLPEIHRALWRHGTSSICVVHEGRLHVLMGVRCPKELLLHVLAEKTHMGLSTALGAHEIQRGLRESLWALGQATASGARLVEYVEGVSWLGPRSYREGEDLVQRLLGPVIEHDRKNQTAFMATLEAYLGNQRSAQKTAMLLFVHRQTVIYRIRKIGELTGLDLAESDSVARLWLALQAYYAMGNQAPAG